MPQQASFATGEHEGLLAFVRVTSLIGHMEAPARDLAVRVVLVRAQVVAELLHLGQGALALLEQPLLEMVKVALVPGRLSAGRTTAALRLHASPRFAVKGQSACQTFANLFRRRVIQRANEADLLPTCH